MLDEIAEFHSYCSVSGLDIHQSCRSRIGTFIYSRQIARQLHRQLQFGFLSSVSLNDCEGRSVTGYDTSR